jgi:hypothetical protein
LDTVFWIGLVLGGIISLGASIVANVYTPKVYSFVGKYVENISEKRKARELDKFLLITRLAKGKVDRTAMLMSRALLSLTFIVQSVFYGSGILLVAVPRIANPHSVLITKSSEVLENIIVNWPVFVLAAFFLSGGIFTAYLSWKYLNQFFDYWFLLDNYNKYRESLRKEWENEVSEIERLVAGEIVS